MNCVELFHVCFHNDEVVQLPASPRKDPYNRAVPLAPGAPSFFERKVHHNLPGYHDSLRGIQTGDVPVKYRMIANALETQDLAHAPMRNVTPVIVHTTWPFNFGESFFRSWIFW